MYVDQRQRGIRSGAAGIHIDECTQAVVLAEIAARVFVASRAIADVADRIQADERRLPPVLPEPECFDSRADRAGLSAMLMHDHFRPLVHRSEACVDEIDFRLHDRKVILRSSIPRTIKYLSTD